MISSTNRILQVSCILRRKFLDGSNGWLSSSLQTKLPGLVSNAYIQFRGEGRALTGRKSYDCTIASSINDYQATTAVFKFYQYICKWRLTFLSDWSLQVEAQWFFRMGRFPISRWKSWSISWLIFLLRRYPPPAARKRCGFTSPEPSIISFQNCSAGLFRDDPFYQPAPRSNPHKSVSCHCASSVPPSDGHHCEDQLSMTAMDCPIWACPQVVGPRICGFLYRQWSCWVVGEHNHLWPPISAMIKHDYWAWLTVNHHLEEASTRDLYQPLLSILYIDHKDRLLSDLATI